MKLTRERLKQIIKEELEEMRYPKGGQDEYPIQDEESATMQIFGLTDQLAFLAKELLTADEKKKVFLERELKIAQRKLESLKQKFPHLSDVGSF
jgi:hypothetical protein